MFFNFHNLAGFIGYVVKKKLFTLLARSDVQGSIFVQYLFLMPLLVGLYPQNMSCIIDKTLNVYAVYWQNVLVKSSPVQLINRDSKITVCIYIMYVCVE